MQIAISAYHQPRGGQHFLTPIAPGMFEWTIESRDLAKARQRLIERVRKELTALQRTLFPRLHVPVGRRLERAHVELVLREDGEKRRISGHFPVVREDRPAGGERLLRIAYHPLRPAAWFELSEHDPLAAEIARHYSRLFDPDEDLALLKSDRKDTLVTLRFQVDPPSLRRLLKSQRERDELATPGQSGDLPALLRVAINQTARAAAGQLPLGLPREPERRRLAQLLCGPKKSSLLLVGPPGSGKSALLAQAVSDLLESEDFATHGNLDKVHNVLRLSGRQIIAGMSYVGQWEARCVELLEHAKRHRRMLWIDDVHAFASIGKTNVSDRVLSDFFRGPLARRDLTVLAECTPEQLSLLQHEAPAFAAAFTIVHLSPATSEQAMAMALFESRRLEETLEIAFEPRSLQALLEQSGSVSSGAALPGRALSTLKALAKDHAQRGTPRAEKTTHIGVDEVLQFFSARTGLPEPILSPNRALSRAELKRTLEQHIMGQDVGLEAACDLILSLRAKLTCPGRPYGVFLFTGPTGTGKTELAKCLAEYLYSTPERLVRFDMGELNTADSCARLIGDAFEPNGQLTSAVRAQPFCVLLFDEVEKAHPSVLNLMLQIFEDARLSDARGSVTDFQHTVIVLTSNLGTGRQAVRGFNADPANLASDVARAVREFFPPELFNRIDRVVPFSPLSVQSARPIVRKELAALVARPGLSERNTFVRFTDAVVERVLRDGYSAEYGARALKRHVDREIGGALARAISAEKPAEMRLLWMHATASGTGVGLQSEALREAEPFAEESSISALLEADYATLLARVPDALAELSRFESDGRLAALGDQLSAQLGRYRLGEQGQADAVFNLDSLKAHAQHLTRRMDARLSADPRLQAAERLRKARHGEALSGQDFTTLGADFGTRFVAQQRERRESSHGQSPEQGRGLLRELAEVALLGGLLETAHEPDRHVALVEVALLSLHSERRRFAESGPGLCAWLAKAYAGARGALDSAAIANSDGSCRVVPPGQLDDALQGQPKLVVLRLIGPGVFDFLHREAGCQLRRTLASGPEIVRVRVLPGHHDPLAWAERHLQAVRAFEDGLEGRGPIETNPEALLPVIRSLRFDPEPPLPSPLHVEDYRLASVTSRRARHLADVLADLWLLGAGLPRLIPHEAQS